MTAFKKHHSDIFYPALAAVAIIAPMLLAVMAGAMPEGLGRGDLVVLGHEVVLAILAAAFVLRAAYIRGFRKAFEILTAERNRSVTA